MKTDYKKDHQSEIGDGNRRSEAEVSMETSGQPTTEDIANLAYALWQERGCPDGSPEEDWYDAEYRLSSSTLEK
jgi:hypothetical protein